MNRVNGKVAVITGAGKGIGRETALLLAREGAKIGVTDIDIKAGEDVAAEIQAAGGEALFLAHDVTDEARWEDVLNIVKTRFGGLNAVVNNAGIGGSAPIEEATLEDWRKTMAVNLDGVFLGTKHGVRAMKGGTGSIVNLSSIEGLIGDPRLAAYNASKGGVRLLTKSAALYCGQARNGVRVNSVHPGFIWTPMVQDFANRTGDEAAARAMLDSRHPIGHVGEPIDVAYGILYLVSDESKFVTGSELVIDGGYTAQ